MHPTGEHNMDEQPQNENKPQLKGYRYLKGVPYGQIAGGIWVLKPKIKYIGA